MRDLIDRIVDRARNVVLDDFSSSHGSSNDTSTSTTNTSDIADESNAIVQITPPNAVRLADKNVVRISVRDRRAPSNQRTILGRFLALPPELQLHIISYLNFGDVERLRRTCRLLRDGIPKPLIRRMFPNLRSALLSTCYLCLSHEATRAALVRADESDARFPLASRCFTCVAHKGGFTVGRKYLLGNYSAVWVCRWCGLPVLGGAAWNQPEFHRMCYRVYNKVLLLYFIVGCSQWAVVLVAAALCWTYYKRDVVVLAPTIVNFIMAFWAFCLTLLRGPSLRTYHWAIILEVAIAALWIPPTYTIVGQMRETPSRHPKATHVTLAFIGINLFYRLLNIIGNVILMAEYKRWRQSQKKATMPPARRVLSKVVSIIIFWTYPQSIEQDYPGTWWFERRHYTVREPGI